jgi:hypothetical protein
MIPYALILRLFVSKCARAGVLLRVVNPAYTSIIGHYKYEKQYGISRHSAAALAIGRRGLGYKDKVPELIACVLHSGEAAKQNARKFSIKKNSWDNVYRHRHHWAHWSRVVQDFEKCASSLLKGLDVPRLRGGVLQGTSPSKFEDYLISRSNPVKLSFVTGGLSELN